MAHFTVAEAQAWAESTKLPVTSIDPDLEQAVTNLVFGQLRLLFPISTWTNESATPPLIRTILAMYYIAAVYDKHYAQEEEAASYSATLRSLANSSIVGLLAGNVTIEEYQIVPETFAPSFFPNDASSANDPSQDFPSDGGPAFLMGSIF
jgi:hypothetical protein